MKTLVLVLVLVSAFLFSGCCCDYFGAVSQQTPGVITEKVVRSLVESCDIEGAYPYMDLNNRDQWDEKTASQKAASKDACLAVMAGAKVTQFQVTSEKISGDTATVNYRVCATKLANGADCQNGVANFVKENGAWKITGSPMQ